MDRGRCGGLLTFTYSPESRILQVKAVHNPIHPPYADFGVKPIIRQYIADNLKLSPAALYRNVMSDKGLREFCVNLTETQVRYIWHNKTSGSWLRGNDPFLSACEYAKSCASVDSELLGCEGYQALMLMNKEAIQCLRRPYAVEELVIDATYGTNSAGYNLFAVLAEVDGTGIPIAYTFTRSTGAGVSSTSTPFTQLLFLLLKRVREAGFSPSFFGCDKDKAEIGAINNVFPQAKVQLCYWHVLRAMKLKLTAYKETGGRSYDPVAAKILIPDLEVCWGSRLEKRPQGHRQVGPKCDCPSRSTSFAGAGRHEAASTEERDLLINLVHRHFNYHRCIPFDGGVYRTAAEIHALCAREMYLCCKARNWWRIWTYFWSEWYCERQWQRWARSANLSIPVLKTTMILESHWRVLKHDFLHQYNRPRMDLVVHCMVAELLPVMNQKLRFLMTGNYRMYHANWRKLFKRDWQHCRRGKLGDANVHYTDNINWVCSCPQFIFSRFLMCNHLVKVKESAEEVSPEFFRTCQRARSCPFWLHPTAVEVQAEDYTTLPIEDENPDVRSGSETDSESDSDDETPNSFTQLKEIFGAMSTLVMNEETCHGNQKFVDKVWDSKVSSLQSLLKDARNKRVSKQMNKTWASRNHPASLFLNSC